MRYGLNAAIIAAALCLARGALVRTARGGIGAPLLRSLLQNCSPVEVAPP